MGVEQQSAVLETGRNFRFQALASALRLKVSAIGLYGGGSLFAKLARWVEGASGITAFTRHSPDGLRGLRRSAISANMHDPSSELRLALLFVRFVKEHYRWRINAFFQCWCA